MKKLILSIAALVAFTFSGYSQCTPDPQFTIGGIYPDSATGLPAAYVGYAYDEVITVVVPLDTIVDLPFVGPTAVPFVDITLDNVTGLPPNFEYNCSPSNCVFPGNSSGCINLYSTANPTSADIGIYPLVVYVTATVDVFGAPTPQSQTIDYYFIEIKDSVVPTVSFNTSSVAVDESAGTVAVDVNIIDQNTGPTTVDVVLGTSTATNGDDFNYTSPTTVTFPANSNTAQTVTLTIIDDAIFELSEDIVLSLQNPTNSATIGSNDTQTITITDNDAAVVSFEAATATVNENVGTVTVNVEILSPNTNATSVDIALGTSTATNGDDFNYTSPTTVTFPANSNTPQTVTVTIIDDAIFELSEDIVLSLQNPTNSATIGSNGTQTITITDNEPNSLVENSLESIVMYPNPTSNGSITLKGIKQQNVIIEIANIIGQTVYKNTAPTNGAITLTDLSKGTYIVTLFNDADRITKKLIIE